MTPIINPWFFYWLEVVDVITNISDITLILSGVSLGAYVLASEGDLNKKTLRKLGALTLISAVVTTFVPTSNTMTKMLVAQNVTYERVEVATDTVQSVYEDIVALFEDGDKDG